MRTTAHLEFLTYARFDAHPGVTNVVTTRRDGDMARDDGRARLRSVTGTDRLARGRQVHGNRVALIDASYEGAPVADTDALITSQLELPLMILVADCVAVSLYDPAHRAIGVAHAGWRGTLADVAGETVRAMRNAFGSDPAQLIAGVSPSIGPCCYEVGPEVAKQFRREQPDVAADVIDDRGREKLDLWGANSLMLARAGVAKENIEVCGRCTSCDNDTFYSYRAEANAGRIANVVMLNHDGARLY